MHETERAGDNRQDREDQSDGEKRLDDASRIHPCRRRPKFRRDEKAERFGYEEFRVNMRDEKQSADQAQNVDAVSQIEILQIMIDLAKKRHDPPQRFADLP